MREKKRVNEKKTERDREIKKKESEQGERHLERKK